MVGALVIHESSMDLSHGGVGVASPCSCSLSYVFIDLENIFFQASIKELTILGGRF
jgi:hypothetical protein